MSSQRERAQRDAARAKLQQGMTVKAEAAAKRRKLQAAIGSAIALVLVVGIGIWVGIAVFSGGKKDSTAKPGATPSAGACNWLPEDKGGNPSLKDVGTPPAGEPHTGTRTMDITSNLGDVSFELDVAHAPCASASFAYLAERKFFDNTKCHRLTTAGISVLQCGDPSASGMGGPMYKFAEENLPTGKKPAYPAGTLAMAKTQAPNTTGSQFFIVYADTDLGADYTIVGKVTKGLDIVKAVAAKGAKDKTGADATDGEPKQPFEIKTLTVGPVTAAPSASTSAGTSPTPAP
ncbi:peptidylprolyl isomerase [Longispora fulva]|uniref:Peptidyl-prolyl cis-trans isomerase B (Cyclophilin B) n=1 Tax=Longispora fulva TaxID=619741 RepID=A0A8J7GLC4_9ACTN|nr:peptidylprolyl isomerase [Longispora fulva]MBG6141789.1 peptidyl-prolyl cis-trans isomerase B (cyclophilin B) [Longispora fulva]GIG59056.1 peptidylprolyl isomerase [Longispora fulva]